MRTACLEITDGYYDTVPTFPSIDLGTWERREWVGNRLVKGLICHGFSFPSVSGTTWSKSLKSMTFRFPVVVLERGGSGPSLSLKLTNQRDTENADCANHSQFRRLARSAEPGFSRPPAAVGCGGPMARLAPTRRKPSATRCPRAAGATLVRTSRTDLTRGRFIASRFRSWGAVANRPALPHPRRYRRLQP
jgi:hypothetical protein